MQTQMTVAYNFLCYDDWAAIVCKLRFIVIAFSQFKSVVIMALRYRSNRIWLETKRGVLARLEM